MLPFAQVIPSGNVVGFHCASINTEDLNFEWFCCQVVAVDNNINNKK